MNVIRRTLVVASAALALGSLGGCVSINNYQTADTMGAGKFQVGVEPSGVFAVPTQGSLPTVGAFEANVSARYGVSDRLDIGAVLGTTGLMAEFKYMFTDPADETLALSVAPTLGGFFASFGGSGGTYFAAKLPVLVGFKVGDGHQLVLGPALTDIFSSVSDTAGTSVSTNTLLIGTTLGFALKLSDGFRIMPEVGFMYPLLTSGSSTAGGATGGGSINGGGILVQAGIGLLFGEPRHAGALPAPPPAPPAM